MPFAGHFCAGVLLAVAGLAIHARYWTAGDLSPAAIEADGGRWVRTADGRLVEYFVCGDPGGTSTYFQHGYGQTGKFSDYVCPAARKLGLRIISPTQPGFGLSSHYPIGRTRRLEEWPADVALILAQENVGDLFVSGVSAGGPHAVTVAHAFQDRVLGIGLATPTAPLGIESSQTNMATVTWIMRHAMMIPFVGDLLAYMMVHLPVETRCEGAPDTAAALAKFKANDPPVAWHTAAAELFVDDMERGTKGNLHRGYCDNMAVLNQDYPFPVSDLNAITSRGKAFVITSSPDDTTNPPRMQHYYKEQVSGARMILVPPGYGHLHLLNPATIEELFRGMMGM